MGSGLNYSFTKKTNRHPACLDSSPPVEADHIQSIIPGSSKGYGLRGFIIALGICVLYAASDEVHQLFAPGRGGQVMDVLIDSAGAILGIEGVRVTLKIYLRGKDSSLRSE